MKRKHHTIWPKLFLLSAMLFLAACIGIPSSAEANEQHNSLTTYEGSKTCNECHEDKALEVHSSVHYQLKGPTPEVPNLGRAGKFGSTNDFCTLPNINWLFEMTNLLNQKVVTGCASCHVGMGRKPNQNTSQVQLDNIDCLMCHSEIYKRQGTSAGSQLHFVPDPSVDLKQVFASIQKPSNLTCLTRCHAAAGGGYGLKQGDLDPAQVDPDPSLDVHLASKAKGGAGLHCFDCHETAAHRIAGRGNDLRPTDLNVPVNCLRCHSNRPHDDNDLNRHTKRVNCTVCHIPTFARGPNPTDVFRDFSRSEQDPVLNRYEPFRRVKSDLVPTYLFWNRLSYFYKFGDPIDIKPNGHFLLAGPLGDISDPNAKIHAFKYHRAKVPYDAATLRLIPVKSKIVWETGNMDRAIREGASALGWSLPQGYKFAQSDRYFSLFHQVAPKGSALQCDDCHGGNRMNFAALGYTPKARRGGQALCASCHDRENADFTEIHQIHVREEGIDCSECHRF